jgi:hypothetical protein
MRLIPISLIFLLAGAAGTASAAPNRFDGVWVATFKGTAICTLEIKDDGNQIAGVSKACKVSVDQYGDLLEGEAPDGSEPPLPFVKPKADGGALRYELVEENGERMTFEFHIVGDGRGDLRFINAPVSIKPIRFDRKP